MATMYIKPSEDKPQFGCYSERGLMSYFMFVELPKRMGDFLKALEFPKNVLNPFKDIVPTNAIIFSELDFGKQGFGCPDGAIYFEYKKGDETISTMILIEAKADETYAKSCKKKKYNSTIKGQLELRWRMKELLLNECFCNNKIQEHEKGNKYLRENELMRNSYTGNNNQPHDDFYTKNRIDSANKLNSMRRLIINKKKSGVEFLINKMIKCENRVYFLVISKDEKDSNPFNTSINLPLCYKMNEGKEDWNESKKLFCWLPITTIEELAK